MSLPDVEYNDLLFAAVIERMTAVAVAPATKSLVVLARHDTDSLREAVLSCSLVPLPPDGTALVMPGVTFQSFVIASKTAKGGQFTLSQEETAACTYPNPRQSQTTGGSQPLVVVPQNPLKCVVIPPSSRIIVCVLWDPATAPAGLQIWAELHGFDYPRGYLTQQERLIAAQTSVLMPI